LSKQQIYYTMLMAYSRKCSLMSFGYHILTGGAWDDVPLIHRTSEKLHYHYTQESLIPLPLEARVHDSGHENRTDRFDAQSEFTSQ